MKKIHFILFAVLGMIGVIRSQGFYDINTINTIEITFQQSNWDYLLDQLVAAGDEERLMGSVTINGVVYDSVGVRYKGNSSYSSNQVKNPFNIKLDYIINDQEIEGYGTLKLANAFKDPSFVRETLSYEIARKYFPASLSNYANVYVNGTHIGLYTNDQDVDKAFMRAHFYSGGNVRFKGEISNISGPPTGGVWQYFGTDSTDYYNYYAIESDYGWDELIDFLDTLNNHNSYVDQVLNIDRHLWFLAFSNLLVNLDGPINNPQNYYIYKDDNGMMNPIPWDLNESFGVYTNHQTLGQLGTTQLQQLSPFANLTASSFPIISKILTNSTYRKIYVAHMKTLIAENFSNSWYYTRALEIQAIINSAVQADPNKFYTYANFISNINSSVGGGIPPSSSVIGITQLMNARISYLNGLSDFTATAPLISNNSYSPLQVTPNSTVWFNATVSSATQVYLGYRHSQSEPFVKTLMYDDGNHQDGAAGDGVYGVSIMAGHTDMQYYIYASNNSAASFSPVRAEYEFYSISITGDFVINEFMADNVATVADPSGEYDDWVELYNNGETPFSLNGYFLSDNASDPGQWAFPDTTVAPGEYLVVWTDNDEDQEGLHANFKLSTSGEAIILSDPGMNIIDEVIFGIQKSDTTTGRYPNGTGSFMEMPPTFGSQNQPFGGIQYNVLAINEFMADNETTVTDQDGEYEDWIELYNNGNAALPMLGLYLSDNALIPNQWAFPDVTIAAGGYLVVWADNDVTQTGLHANFKLSAGGEAILLSDSELNILDEISFGPQKTDTTTGRFPNGIGYFMEMLPTFGTENDITISVNYDNLVINEFMADNATTVTDQDGEYDDWIELYNNGPLAIPLNGVYLSDDPDLPGQWSFPDTTIAAGGYLIVWADNDVEEEGLHANFKLSASGESVVIADLGWNIIDAVEFGNQTTDISYGRYPNGTGSFSEMPATFATENEIFCNYCLSTYSNTTDDWISNVTFNTINNYSGQGGTDSYEDFSTVSTNVEPGQTYPISITFVMNGSWHQDCFAFIDWNRDCDFNDTNESIDLGFKAGSGTLTSSISIPLDATPGSRRLRIVEQYNQNPGACDAHPTVYGETEDYTINILHTDIVLDMNIFLEGPFETTEMSSGLSVIPLNQPYNVSPWNYTGTETVSSIPNSDIVDWVLVELRDAPNAASANSATVKSRQAAFVLIDGSVVDIDGTSNVLFTDDITQQLFVVLYHRNHISVMSANPLSELNGIYTYDFSTGMGQVYGGSSGHKEIATGIWGMVSGDGDSNNAVNSSDKTNWMIQAGLQGYLGSDFNMDGNVNNIDKDDRWLPNNAFGGQVPD